ncbi:MAG: hypothetical protein JWN01_167 [Patescibacteria group bacterium]|nr:hypothetical protein [Patescibacteria group bacterium]
MEAKENRLKRLEDGSPVEIVETLLNSIDNGINREINAAASVNAWDLVFTGIHSTAVTIGTGFFSASPLTAFTQFLSTFMDGPEAGGDFSAVAGELHGWRQVLVHRWLSKRGYEFGFDLQQTAGWRRDDATVWVNPELYCQAYRAAFAAGGPMWHWQDLFSSEEAEAVKARLLAQYHR